MEIDANFGITEGICNEKSALDSLHFISAETKRNVN
jgi:hypothetical protein